jgi:hypothetical protein
MENLQKHVEALAQRRAVKIQTDAKTALAAELPDHVTISENRDGIVVAAPDLADMLIGDSSLRDIAFLMRAVR